MQTELDLPRRAADVADQSKAGVLYAVIRVCIARYVEDIEKVSTEADDVLLRDVEVLEQRGINLSEPWRALSAVLRSAEGVRTGLAIGTDSIVHSGLETRCC